MYYVQGFETCPAGWTLTGDWECGLITGGADGGIGPQTAFAGSNAIGTLLNLNYNNTDGGWNISLADSPPISLAGATEPTLVFRAWVDSEGSTYDGFNLRASTDMGASFPLITTVTPAYPLTIASQQAWGGRQSGLGWQRFSANLTSLAGQQVLLRFAFRAETSVNYPGIYIDDVRVQEANQVALAIGTTTLPNALLPGAYSTTLTRSGGSTGATWSIVPGGTNTTWLSIDPVSGVLSGTPTMANLGPVTVTIRVSEPANPSNFASVTFMFVVAQSPTVTSIAVTGLPTGFTPGWGLALSGANLFFTVTDSTSMTSSTGLSANRNGLGSVPSTGGAYTSAYDPNQTVSLADGGVTGAPLDPQVVLMNGANLYAFNGLFSGPRGTGGVYQITSPTTAVAKTTNGAPFNSGSKYGWYGNGENFYFAQFTGAPYDILGANMSAATAVAMTNVTNFGSFSGPHGVAVSATRVYVFDGASSIRTYQLDGALSPSVPMVDPMVPVNIFTTASPCNVGSARTVAALNSPMFPTKLYYTSWGVTAGASGAVANRICEVDIAATGLPTGTPRVVAGPTIATATAGSVDGLATAATFQNITGLAFDNVGSRLYVLQKSNAVDATKIIRIVNIP